MTSTNDWSTGSGRTGFSDQLHDLWHTRPMRFPKDGPLAGVAVGFGRRYHVDPVLVRVAFVVSALFGGAGVVLYLLAWLLLPQTGDQSSAAESLFGRGRSSQSSSKTIVLMVALGIAVSTVGPVGVGLGGSGLLSFGLMLAGWWLLYQRQPLPPAAYPGNTGTDSLFNTGYPGTTSPYWNGYPAGTPTNAVTFETYGPYTKLPDRYEPGPDRPDGTEVLAPEGVSGAPLASNAGTAVPPVEPAETRTTTPNPEPVSAQGLSPLRPDEAGNEPAPAVGESETVVLRKETSTPTSEPVALDKTPDATDESTPENRTPLGVKTPALHPIPPTTDMPRAGYGPAPISPEFGPTPSGWDPLGVSPLAWELPAPHQPPVQQLVREAPPRRPRSRLTAVTIGLAILAAAAAGAMAASGVEWMTPPRIAAAGLAVIAIGLITGAFLRRGYGLMVLLAPLAGFVVLASLIGPIQFDQGAMGDHTWTATSGAELQPEYHISMGSGTLDLSGLQLTEDRSVKLSIRAGDARVILPPNLRVDTTCTVHLGDSNCVSGLSGPPTGPILNLDVDVHMGSAEVKRG